LENLTNADFWRQKWLGSQDTIPRWDLKGEHPLLNDLIAAAVVQGRLPSGASIYVPGCGRAHDAWGLSRRGYDVLATDIVPEAVAHAKTLYLPDDHFRVEIGDVFAAGEQLAGQYDAVFDRAMLGALDPSRRLPFVASMTRLLKKGGLFMSIGFGQIVPDKSGPPFAIDIFESERLFSENFSLVMAEHRTDGSVDEVVLEEILNIWRKA
jgi:thiopurine S-methyltransferase